MRWIYLALPYLFVILGALYLRSLQMWMLWWMTDWDPLIVGTITGGGFIVALWCLSQSCSFLLRRYR